MNTDDELSESELDIHDDKNLDIVPLIEKNICSICMLDIEEHCMNTITCEHSNNYCLECIQHYFSHEIKEGRTKIRCPDPDCRKLYELSDILTIIGDDTTVIEKYDEFSFREHLLSLPDFSFCPNPSCNYGVIGCTKKPKTKCPLCKTKFCITCKSEWHVGKSCKKYQQAIKDNLMYNATIKPCPTCKIMVDRIDGCNHMECAACHTEFCWICLNIVTEDHFTGLGSCSYYGKKPESGTKRIKMTVVAASISPVLVPVLSATVGISLQAYIPYKLSELANRRMKERDVNKHLRRLALFGTVIGTTILGTVTMAATVSLGTLIGYGLVYGWLIPKGVKNGDTYSVERTRQLMESLPEL